MPQSFAILALHPQTFHKVTILQRSNLLPPPVQPPQKRTAQDIKGEINEVAAIAAILKIIKLP